MSEYPVTLILPVTATRNLPTDTGAPLLVRGTVGETCGQDEHPVAALVLIEDPADAGPTVWAQPVALVCLGLDGEQFIEVVCVGEGSEPARFDQLVAGPGGPAWLGEAAARAHGTERCAVLAVEDVCRAEQLLGRAWLDYLRVHLHG
jgi:hypothetical protein